MDRLDAVMGVAMTSLQDGSERIYEIAQPGPLDTLLVAVSSDSGSTWVWTRRLWDYLREGLARPCCIVGSQQCLLALQAELVRDGYPLDSEMGQ